MLWGYYYGVQHIAVYTRASFMEKLQDLSEDDYEDFESLENVDK